MQDNNLYSDDGKLTHGRWEKAGNMIETIKENLKKLTELEEASGAAEKKYEESPDDVKAEIEFDKAYKEEYEMYMLVSSEIAVFFTIENALARKMVKTKRKELISLL